MFDANVEAFIAWDAENSESIKLKRSYVELTGDLNAGILLSQIVYWHLPDKTGKTKLRVWKHGEFWLAKTRTDWWEECCLTPKQFDRAIAILESKDLVNCQLFRFAGSPTKHIRLNWETLNCSLKALSSKFLPKGENPIHPKGNLELDQKGNSLTETTAKNTAESTGGVLSISREMLDDRPLSNFSDLPDGNVTNGKNHAQSNGDDPKIKKKERPAILPKNKKLDYDEHGWVILPTQHKRYKVACKLAIRRMQIWIAQTYLSDCIEITEENGLPYFSSGHTADEGHENEFFEASGEYSLRAMRNYAVANEGLGYDEFDEKLQEFFWDSVAVEQEYGRDEISKFLDDGTVFFNFED